MWHYGHAMDKMIERLRGVNHQLKSIRRFLSARREQEREISDRRGWRHENHKWRCDWNAFEPLQWVQYKGGDWRASTSSSSEWTRDMSVLYRDLLYQYVMNRKNIILSTICHMKETLCMCWSWRLWSKENWKNCSCCQWTCRTSTISAKLRWVIWGRLDTTSPPSAELAARSRVYPKKKDI